MKQRFYINPMALNKEDLEVLISNLESLGFIKDGGIVCSICLHIPKIKGARIYKQTMFSGPELIHWDLKELEALVEKHNITPEELKEIEHEHTTH